MRHTPELIVRDILHAIRRRSRDVRGPTSKMRSAHRNDCRGMPMSSGWSAVPAQRVSSLRSHVEKTLSAAIISGQLKPGDMLTVPTLAAEFEGSATPVRAALLDLASRGLVAPVREALLDLASRGLVAPVRNKGFRVTEVSEEQAQHIADIRMLLEPPAMRRLAEAFDASKEPEVRALADKIVQGARDGDIKSYL